MRKLHDESALRIFKDGNGIIIAYAQDSSNGRIAIKYKRVSFDTGRATGLSKNDFLYFRFGGSFTSFEMQLPNHLSWRTVVLPDSNILAVNPEGVAKVLDGEAAIVWQGRITYQGMGPSDIALYKDTIWASFGRGNALVRYNLRSKREELRIGGGVSSAFADPGSVWVEDNIMTVCNTERHNLLRVNLDSYEVFKYAEFEEPVYQYLTVGKAEFVLLDSGLYVI